jgi:predicted  nucleic acid-binding Zn-ribbon protein
MDVAREKLMRLMAEIDELEERVEELQQKLRASGGSSSPRDRDASRRELGALLERLEQKRDELTRVSNACRRPHSNV